LTYRKRILADGAPVRGIAPSTSISSSSTTISTSTSTTTSTTGFGERLTARVLARESQIVLGLDPDPMALWPQAGAPSAGSARERAAAAVVAHCRALIDATAPACVAVKAQLARFEVLGAPGWSALEALVAHAHESGLLVILDAKRGDIDVSARAYARALTGVLDTPFGAVRGLEADMFTVNPLMGADALEPFVAVARESGAGVLALVRTSNPGAADIEELELRDGSRVWERIAALVEALGRDGVGESGISDVGAVVGATAPEHLARARELMPHAVFLLPGVGAQGGRVEDLAPAFAAGRGGGLIAASRSIANAHRSSGTGESPTAAARREAERLRGLAWGISG
jgi:orotidine-5'-phosphate decarboxylase